MFGQLFESHARGQRRTGGASLSVAAHVALIGTAAVVTASGKSAPPSRVEVVAVRFAPPPAHAAPPTEPQHVSTTPRISSTPQLSVTVKVIDVPTVVPTTLPAIDLTHAAPADSFVIGAPAGPVRGRPGLGDLLADAPSDGEWRGTELLMRIVSSAKPHYPESLRQAGIDGRVLVRFTVDTIGAVDMSSVQIISSTHDLFTRSVRDALASFRFRPSEVSGKRVRSLAEMPFEFAISK